MTYKECIKSIESVYGRHPIVNTVMYSRVAVERGQANYPILLLLPTSVSFLRGVGILTITVAYIERYNENPQVLDIQSRGFAVIASGINKLSKIFDDVENNHNISNTLTNVYTPFVDLYSDKCAGVTATLNIAITDDIGECFIDDCNTCG